MQAKEAKLLPFLSGPKQFIIPIYQRTYSWNLEQCERLWQDILRAAQNETATSHFIGAIVYIQKNTATTITSVPQWLVIDGQQRLTTISLLITALSRVMTQQKSDIIINEESRINQKKLENYYLVNADEDGERHYKLLLTQTDRETLMSLVRGRELPSVFSPRLKENYEYFLHQLTNSTIDLRTLYTGISKLSIVDVALEQGRDDPQLIFDSLNSTGLDLTQADRIRNYVLMGLETPLQNQLYNDYWLKMEQSFAPATEANLFDRFIRDYLTVKTVTIPNIRDIYSKFKEYAVGQNRPIIDLVQDIYRYSKFFIGLARPSETNLSKGLKLALADLNLLKVEVAYPFLMEVYDSYEQTIIKEDVFEQIVRLVESYVLRRAICGLPTNALNKTFLTLSREINKTKYLESFKAAFLNKEGYARFPSDEEFATQFAMRDIYNSLRRNYILRKLENHGYNETTDIESYTIEHIMPQNPTLSTEWQTMLGPNWKEIQTKYLHTIGNLTLTGYNASLSDKPFLEKRDMPKGGFAVSPLRLNQNLRSLTIWNEEEINKRAQALSERATKIWEAPSLPDTILQTYRQSQAPSGERTYTLADYSNFLQGDIGNLFTRLSNHILNLHPSVRQEVKARYIAYKTTTNFVDIVPQKSRLRLSLNMRFSEINDPKGLCQDVSGVGRWGNGEVEIGISSVNQMEDVMELIKQSFDKHTNAGQTILELE